MFITFEGGEGAGKSTQAALLAERLRAAGYPTHLTREPGGTPLAGAVRALLLHPEESLRALGAAHLADAAEPAEAPLPLTEALLLAAARTQHVARIHSWLAEGRVVVCDRFADATRAYQGAARGLDSTAIETLIALATGGLAPDLTILLDLPVADGRERKLAGHARGGDWNRLDAEGTAFHERVRAAYLALAAADPARWVVIDATFPREEQAAHIWQVVAARLPSR